jgi:flagellar motor switch protein FliN/FliY
MSDATATPESAAAAEVEARPTEFAQLSPGPAVPSGSSLDSFRDVPITITAQLGHTVLSIAEILKLAPGAVVELDEAVGTPIELTVRGVPFATGEVVVVDDHFAVRIKSLLPPRGGKSP